MSQTRTRLSVEIQNGKLSRLLMIAKCNQDGDELSKFLRRLCSSTRRFFFANYGSLMNFTGQSESPKTWSMRRKDCTIRIVERVVEVLFGGIPFLSVWELENLLEDMNPVLDGLFNICDSQRDRFVPAEGSHSFIYFQGKIHVKNTSYMLAEKFAVLERWLKRLHVVTHAVKGTAADGKKWKLIEVKSRFTSKFVYEAEPIQLLPEDDDDESETWVLPSLKPLYLTQSRQGIAVGCRLNYEQCGGPQLSTALSTIVNKLNLLPPKCIQRFYVVLSKVPPTLDDADLNALAHAFITILSIAHQKLSPLEQGSAQIYLPSGLTAARRAELDHRLSQSLDNI